MSDSPKRILNIEPLPAAAPEVGHTLWLLVETRKRLHEALAEVTPAELDWTPPYAGGNSIGTLLYHIAAVETDWLFAEVLESPFSPEIEALLPYAMREADGRLTPVAGVTLAAHLARLHAVRQTLLDTFNNMSTADFHRLRCLEPYDVSPAWVLFHLLHHEAEHTGQILELRQMQRARQSEKSL